MKRIGIIGCGTMGSAIAQSLGNALVYDSQKSQLDRIGSKEGIEVASSLEDLLERSETVLLAVKPQVLPTLYPTLSHYQRNWISIAAGTSLSRLSEGLKSETIVRLLPNIAAREQKSVTALAAHTKCPPSFASEAASIARSFGTVVELEERLFDGFIGISASAIAFALEFVHALSMGGVGEGIAYPQAQKIVTATLGSTIAILESSSRHPVELVSSVCSAGGTTIEGMAALADGAFDATVMNAVRASAQKSRTMEAEALNHNSSEETND